EGDSENKGDSKRDGDSKNKGNSKSKGDNKNEGDSKQEGNSENKGNSEREGNSKNKGNSKSKGDQKSEGDSKSKGDSENEGNIETGRLSRKEAEIVREADKALTLLHDEGSSIAFPESIGQMRDDMEQVVVLLAQKKTDIVTQGVEEDIIAALEEMIAALKKAQK